AAAAALPDPLSGTYNATFQQAQFLAYSPALTAVLQEALTGEGARITALPDPSDRVRATFAASYGRAPDAVELARARDFLEAHAGPPAEGIRDLQWALLTSAEFLTMP
ncbi:MAG: hypothetical protein J0L84_20465, partial [Verrucomicrobia bacterium]|nr:hypothetical protein [Verrucomicrobiota bacterium]